MDSISALKTTAFAAIINIILNYYLIGPMGILGASVATFVSYLLVFIYRFVDIRKYVCIEVHHKMLTVVQFITLIIIAVIISIRPTLYFLSIFGLFFVGCIQWKNIVKIGSLFSR